MKKLIAILLISVAGVSCKKDREEQKACWDCILLENSNNKTSEVDRAEICDKTEPEIRDDESKFNSAFGPEFTKQCTFKRSQ